jgi:hypothetical protein
VAVDEVVRHGKERRGFIKSQGSVGFRGVMGAGTGARQQVDELLEHIRQFGVRVRLDSGLFGSHA